MTKQLRDARWLAGVLSVPIGTVYSLVFKGLCPCIRVSRRMLRFDPDEIENWLRSKSQSATPVPATPVPVAPKLARHPKNKTTTTAQVLVEAAIKEAEE